MSCPSWARGLKYMLPNIQLVLQVVPLVGTWIEISPRNEHNVNWVVPLVGTWIEIPLDSLMS